MNAPAETPRQKRTSNCRGVPPTTLEAGRKGGLQGRKQKVDEEGSSWNEEEHGAYEERRRRSVGATCRIK